MYKTEILADSLSPQGSRLTTMKINFPRFILAEFNTHRMFSRNSASSRAIPFNKMVKMVEENPFIPIAWQKDHKGMQGIEYLEIKPNVFGPVNGWLEARDKAVELAKYLNELDVTKQLCNRLLEPFMWHTVIVTATEWENFFKLRCPQYKFDDIIFKSIKEVCDYIGNCEFVKMDGNTAILTSNNTTYQSTNVSQAEIHIQAIAELMWDEFNSSTPKQLSSGQWHIPFGDNIKGEDIISLHYNLNNIPKDNAVIVNSNNYRIKIATARCARISYQTLGDNPKIDYEADIRLHDRLLAEGHMSPFEHCARAMNKEEYFSHLNGKAKMLFFINTEENQNIKTYEIKEENCYGWSGNFRGFIQYRKMIEDKNKH